MSLDQLAPQGQPEFVAPSSDEALAALTEPEQDAKIIPFREGVAPKSEEQVTEMRRRSAEAYAKEMSEKAQQAVRAYNHLKGFADEAKAKLDAAVTPNAKARAEQFYNEQNVNAENAYVRMHKLMNRAEKAQAELDTLDRSIA